MAGLAILYLIVVRDMTRGGGPPTPDDLAAQAAGMILGLPPGSAVAGVVGVLVFILCGVQVWRRYRAADVAWPMFLAALLFVPAVLFCVPRSEYIHPRYLYVVVPLLLILLGMELVIG